MQSFIDRHSLTFDSIEDQTGEVFAEFGVPFQPAWVFIDEDKRQTRVQGSLNAESLAQKISEITG